MKTLLYTILFFLPALAIGQSTCENVDFEDGNLDGWLTHGNSEIVTRNQQDPFGNFNLASSGFYSIKLGSETDVSPSGASRSFLVTADSRYFIYSYASVMAGAHGEDEAANFKIEIFDDNDSVIPCTSLIAYAVPGNTSGYIESDSTSWGNVIYYKPWESNVVDLSEYVGQVLTIKLSCRWCVYNVHWSYAYIDSYCTSQLIYTHKTCDDQDFQINTIPGFDNYYWQGPGIVSGQGTSTITIDQPGLYTVDMPNKTVGCDSLHLEVTANLTDLVVRPLVNFEFDAGCVYDEVVFENSSTGSVPIVSCLWYVNGVLQNSTWNLVYVPSINDSVQVTLICENQLGCIDSINISYMPLNTPVLHLIDDQTICPGEPVYLFEVEAYHGNLVWSNGILDDTCVANNEGVYYATISNGLCDATDSVSVFANSSYLGEIPNVFTPNADQVNDRFDLPVENLEDYHLVITNRWGNLVFESYDEHMEWDGTVHGDFVESGVYFYQITYTCNQPRSKSGFVQVFK